MLTKRSQVLVHAPLAEVWKVVTGMEFYSEWNSQLSLLDGQVQSGEKIRIRFKPFFYKSFTLTPRIHCFTPLTSFGWKGVSAFPRLLDGEYLFEMKPVDSYTTRLTYTQRYSGLLAFVLPRFEMFKDAHKSCIKMNAEIKRRVEEIFAAKTAASA